MPTPRTTCAACAHTGLDIFLDLGKTPLANKFPAEADLGSETFYPLQLGKCGSCGLVQSMVLIPDSEIYGDDYGFFSGGSQAQRDYHTKGASLLKARHLQGENTFVVEVACNDGSLLRHFDNALGVDPAGPADLAIADGMNVIKEPFTYALGRRIRDEHGPAALVIAYNSLAHVGDLADVIAGIRALLDDDGVAVVEVQYLPDLLAGNMYDQVYHEHRYFHSLSSFKRAAELHGLFVADAELIELQGGGIRITLSPDPDRHITDAPEMILAKERWLALDGTYVSMQGRIDRIRDHLIQLVEQEVMAGHMVAGYAAAAKATTILNFCGFTPHQIPFVIDTTPYKQGRFVPGTGIPILGPDHVAIERVGSLLLLAPNYLSTVLRANSDKRIIMPIPNPTII